MHSVHVPDCVFSFWQILCNFGSFQIEIVNSDQVVICVHNHVDLQKASTGAGSVVVRLSFHPFCDVTITSSCSHTIIAQPSALYDIRWKVCSFL